MRKQAGTGWRILVSGLGLLAPAGPGRPGPGPGPGSRDGHAGPARGMVDEDARGRSSTRPRRGTSTCSSWATRSPRDGDDNEVWKRFYGPAQRGQLRHRRRPDRSTSSGGSSNGEIDGIKPRVVVLMIGTNNSGSNTADEIADGRQGDRQGAPRASSPRPRSCSWASSPGARSRTATRDEARRGERADRQARRRQARHLLDIGKAFLNPDGTISQDIMPDYLHLTAKGYRIWADAIEPTLWGCSTRTRRRNEPSRRARAVDGRPRRPIGARSLGRPR